MKKIGAMILTALILMGTVAVWLLGIRWKGELQRNLGGYETVPSMAVPFLMLKDDTDLITARQLRETPARATEPTTEPPTEPTTEPITDPTTEPATEPTTEPPPVAVYGEDEHYFDNALFIGDSRMVGISQYGRLGQADYFADVGMNVFRVFSTWTWDENFGETDLESLLEDRDYGKIYVMLGINECGYPLESLTNAYGEMVNRLRELEPEADVYILKIYGVSRSKASSASYFTPGHLGEVNDALETLADGEHVFCLDPRPVFEDEEGYLREEYSGDGVHLYGKYAYLLPQWLCEQAT